jgi:2,5-diketo-D-gluconate reductase B
MAHLLVCPAVPGGTTIWIQGVEVPRIGLGTWQVTGRECREAVEDALALGYRHVDTARMYDNEREVGDALVASGVPREALWVTTKVWYDQATADGVRASCEASLRDLGTDYVDLLLLHWPTPDVPLRESMRALATVAGDHLALRVGVSNFPTDLVAAALDYAPVFCNQVEYHPYLGQPDLLRQAREQDLLLTAYSPFAHGWLLDEPVLEAIAAAHGRRPSQIALRWLLDQPQVCAIPKASSRERRAENIDVFDFALSDEERDRIAMLDRGLRTADPPWAPAWD